MSPKRIINRRGFFRHLGLSGLGLMALIGYEKFSFARGKERSVERVQNSPLVISTWMHGLAANEVAYKILKNGGRALDAAEKGVNVSEDDPKVRSVGYGGRPDRTGRVTLDACIMDERGNAGGVAFVQNYKNPVSIARKVMEETPHILLVGKGAEEFARKNGFTRHNLLTEESRREWLEWKEKQKEGNISGEGHDTIGMLTMDIQGNIAGACTTSGLSFKMYGRVGDSPLIGSGLYADNKVGAAAATGKGEECIKICGTFLIVELMRQGATPYEACREALIRSAEKYNHKPDFQLGFIAMNIAGETAGMSMLPGFEYALYRDDVNRLFKADFLIK